MIKLFENGTGDEAAAAKLWSQKTTSMHCEDSKKMDGLLHEDRNVLRGGVPLSRYVKPKRY